MPINLERVRSNLLCEAISDYTGLYEVAWDCATDAADVPEVERIAAARTLVQELLAKKHARLFRSTTWPPVEYEVVSSDRWSQVIADDQSFKIPTEPEPPVLYWVLIER